MSKFDVNFNRLALLLLPTFWRKPILSNIACSIIAPFNYLHTHFYQFREDFNYRLGHNGQVCYLRAILNDLFDPEERRITITDNEVASNVFVLHHRKERIQLLPDRSKGMFLINRKGFGGINGYDFYINIPAEISEVTDLSRLKTIINTYKLASKRFLINSL